MAEPSIPKTLSKKWDAPNTCASDSCAGGDRAVDSNYKIIIIIK